MLAIEISLLIAIAFGDSRIRKHHPLSVEFWMTQGSLNMQGELSSPGMQSTRFSPFVLDFDLL